MNLQLLLEAHDAWFFRTSRPFGAVQSAASDGEADLLPPPGTIFGALRTALGEQHRLDWDRDYHAMWQNWHGGAPPTALSSIASQLGPPHLGANQEWPADAIRLVGYLPARIENDGFVKPLFPLPAFVLANKDDHSEMARAHPTPPRSAGGDHFAGQEGGLWPVLVDKTGFRGEYRQGLITKDGFLGLLRGDAANARVRITDFKELAVLEPRVGIARDIDKRTTREGMLYTLALHRWHARVEWNQKSCFGLLAGIGGIDAKAFPAERFVLNLGGERRLAWGKTVGHGPWFTDDERQQIRAAVGNADGWFLTLMTPGAFTNGWCPRWVQQRGNEEWHAELPGAAGRPVALGRLRGMTGGEPELRSGWDLARNRPKPVRQYLPTGTTWFFESPPTIDDEFFTLLDGLQGTCLADVEAHAGYGFAFVGAWKGRRS